MRRVLGKTLITLFILSLILPVAGAWAGPPTDTVKGVVDEVIRLLKDPALKAPAQRKQRRQLIKQAIDRHFDYEEMAKRSLGATWGSLSRSQRQEFVSLFAELLEASYADKIEKYHDEKVAYTGESQEADYAEVRTQLVRKNDKIPMNYRMLDKSKWMVYDVVIEGVSLVNNYRSQFGRIIRESGYQGLLKRLRTKVTELQKTDKLKDKDL
ncbi:MAG: ABC transporter substrate-binding protein [Thermodesulfobacteriota bacterium]